jgi:acetyltransferase-like isoleucine patch superfamily enzyme
MLSISDTARVSRLADIEDSVKGSRIVIGDHVTIDSFVKIKPAGGLGDVVIGAHTIINSGVVIYTGNGMTMGRHVMVAANCVFSPTSHEYRSRDVPIMYQGFKAAADVKGGRAGIVIEDDVWLGASCVVLEGAWLQRGVVVGAGSVVKGVLESYGIYAGNPLKLLGYRR